MTARRVLAATAVTAISLALWGARTPTPSGPTVLAVLVVIGGAVAADYVERRRR